MSIVWVCVALLAILQNFCCINAIDAFGDAARSQEKVDTMSEITAEAIRAVSTQAPTGQGIVMALYYVAVIVT